MKKVLKIIKIIIEIAIIAAFIATIVYLFGSSNGILGSSKYEKAQSKLDTAIKIFTSTDATLAEALNDIEGLDSLDIDEENGMYTIVIDGIDFLVVSQEILNGGEDIEGLDTTIVEETEANEEENTAEVEENSTEEIEETNEESITDDVEEINEEEQQSETSENQ